jgi:hypothetical protein
VIDEIDDGKIKKEREWALVSRSFIIFLKLLSKISCSTIKSLTFH